MSSFISQMKLESLLQCTQLEVQFLLYIQKRVKLKFILFHRWQVACVVPVEMR